MLLRRKDLFNEKIKNFTFYSKGIQGSAYCIVYYKGHGTETSYKVTWTWKAKEETSVYISSYSLMKFGSSNFNYFWYGPGTIYAYNCGGGDPQSGANKHLYQCTKITITLSTGKTVNALSWTKP